MGEGAVLPVIASNGVPFLQMRSVHSTSGKEKEGRKEGNDGVFLQLSRYRPLFYNSTPHCPLLQCIRTTSEILARAHYYYVVSSFKCEEKNNCHHLNPNPRIIRLCCLF